MISISIGRCRATQIEFCPALLEQCPEASDRQGWCLLLCLRGDRLDGEWDDVSVRGQPSEACALIRAHAVPLTGKRVVTALVAAAMSAISGLSYMRAVTRTSSWPSHSATKISGCLASLSA